MRLWIDHIHFSLTQSSVIRAFLVGTVIIVIPASASFAQNGFGYAVDVRGVYDTNPLTRSDDQDIEEIAGVETELSVVFEHEAALSEYSAGLSFTRNQFDASEFNSNDVSLVLRAKRQFKKLFFNFLGSGTRDTTRTSRLDTLNEDNVFAGRRDNLNLQPSLVYEYSPRGFVGVNFNWTENDYANATGLTDHRTYSASPFTSYKLTRLQTASVALLYQKYESLDGPDVNVESVGPFVTWDYNFLPTTTLSASLGFLSTEFEGLGLSDDREVNPIYSVALEHETARLLTSVNFERLRQGQSNGSETDLTIIDFNNRYKLSRRWDLNLDAEYRKSEQSDFSTDTLDNSYAFDVGSNYDISRNLSFSTSYRYVNRSFTNDTSDAERSIFRAGLEYSFY